MMQTNIHLWWYITYKGLHMVNNKSTAILLTLFARFFQMLGCVLYGTEGVIFKSRACRMCIYTSINKERRQLKTFLT
jgi:hypothetical protein